MEEPQGAPPPVPVNEDGVQVGAETTHVCPVCQTMLSDGTVQNRPVLYCAKCRGLLVSINKFLPLVEFLRALWRPAGANIEPRDNSDADRKLTCPMCDGTMIGHPYGGPGNVNIDTCERCSVIWLDHNELRRIALAPDRAPLYSRYDSGGGPRPF
jgi:Zn-finger nucleic acid-binding protein